MNTPETARLRAEIEQTREQLGDTVQALVHKVDVPARAKEKLHETRDAAQEKARQATAKLPEPVRERGQQAVVVARRRPVPLAAAVLAVLVLGWLLRRRWLS
jgi:hypothetical protein